MTISTNVWVPASAVAALDEIKVHESYRSRNQALASVLGDYVDHQRERGPEGRVVHIATLLRWPPPRREDRLVASHRGVPTSGRQLRLNVERELWITARDHGYVLPGQSTVRGHPEYQARRGADAVLAAIARRRPLTDPVLGQIEQLLTRRQARGLWRLAVAGTSTVAERQVAELADDAREALEIAGARGQTLEVSGRVVRVAEKLRTSQVTWHASERFRVLSTIAFENLSGEGAQDFLDLLDEVDDDTVSWRDELARLRVAPIASVSREGRGATAVWRAEREVQTEDLMDWFGRMDRASTPTSFVMHPPGWVLRFPTQWLPAPADDETLSRSGGIDAGHVLRLRHAGNDFVWPTRENTEGLMTTVPGFETVLTAAGRRSAQDVLEATLLDFSQELHDGDPMPSVWVPAHIAHDLGLIDETERDRLVSEARAACDADLARSEDEPHYKSRIDLDILFADLDREGSFCQAGDRERARMAFAGGIRTFVQYLVEIGYPAVKSEYLQFAFETKYRYPMSTLAEAVQAGELRSDALRWVSAYVFSRRDAILNTDVQKRWIRAEVYAEFDDSPLEGHLGPTAVGHDASDLCRPIGNELQPSLGPDALPF